MNENDQGDNVVSELYDNYAETQKEILAIEIRKTRNKLISVAVVVFLFDLLALSLANVLTMQTIVVILVMPVIILGLAFLAMKEPMLAMIVAAVLILGLWVYAIVASGGRAAVAGWLSKAVIVYLLIAGFQNAREAAKIRNEMKDAI